MKKKKLNPRRIPMAKALVDKNAILEEATQDDMYHAWLLVVHSILELELLPADEIAALADSVNKCIASTSLSARMLQVSVTEKEYSSVNVSVKE